MTDGHKERLHRVIRVLFGIISCGTILIVLFVDKKIEYSNLCKLETGIPNPVLWAGALCMLLGVWRLCRCRFFQGLREWCGKHFGVCLLGMSVCLLALQLLLAYEIYFMTGWDAGIVHSVAYSVAAGTGEVGDFYYYSQYVNNIAITFVLAVIQKIAMWIGLGTRSYFVCVAAGCLFVNLACVFTALSVRKMTNSPGFGILGFGLMSVVAGLSPWITIPYTDAFSVVFPPLTFYLYLCAGEKTGYRAWFLYLLTGLAGGVGYLIKPSAGIVLIAVVCVEFFRFFTVKGARKKILCNLLGIVLALLMTALFREGMTVYLGCDLNEELQFSLTHYLMMGLNQENTGGYYSPDYGFSSSFATRQERMQGNLQVSFQRLKDFGLKGYGYFLIQKLLTNFNDGTFSWWMEGGFFQKDMGHHATPLQQVFRSVYYKEGAWYPVYAAAAQGIWLAVQTLVLGSLAQRKKERSDEYTVMWLSLLGMFLFVMLFEARGRYLFCMLGMYCMCATVGWKDRNK